MGQLVLTLAEQEEVPPARGLAILEDCLIENNEFGAEGNEIVRIAWGAVRMRLEAASKQGNQLLLNGTIQENGYVTYEDYDQYMEERKHRELLKLANWDLGRVRHEIKDTLLSRGWMSSPNHPETRFYPPRPGC